MPALLRHLSGVRCLIVLLAFASVCVAQRNTYYVDSVAGDDAAAGTLPGTAWKSLTKINQTVFQPGDTLLLKSGSAWIGQLWPKGSGRDGSPITLGRYGDGPKPAIEGAGRAEDTFLLKNQQYWQISDLEITNHGRAPAVRRGVHIAAENCGDLHHIYLRSLTVHDVNGRDDSKENGGIIYTSVGKTNPSRFVDLRIEGNHVYHVDRNGISGWSTHWPRPAWYPSLGVIVRNNKLEDVGGDGIMIAVTDGALIERNVVGHANQRSNGYNIAIWPGARTTPPSSSMKHSAPVVSATARALIPTGTALIRSSSTTTATTTKADFFSSATTAKQVLTASATSVRLPATISAKTTTIAASISPVRSRTRRSTTTPSMSGKARGPTPCFSQTGTAGPMTLRSSTTFFMWMAQGRSLTVPIATTVPATIPQPQVRARAPATCSMPTCTSRILRP